jgi:nucleoside-diphosphate-sugar epimerase
MLSGKNVLVTGATGFIGSNLARRLLKERCNVHIITRKGSSRWRIEDIKEKIKIYECRFESAEDINQVVNEIKPDYIFHLASYGGFSSQKDLNTVIDTNIIGTLNLLRACMVNGFIMFINTGTSSEYGIKHAPMVESNSLDPLSSYSSSKASLSIFLGTLGKSMNLPVVTLRPFAVYGYYEEKERLIPHLILSALKGQNPQLSTPNSVRDFIFIEDLVEGYVRAAMGKNLNGEIINLGSAVQHTIDDTAKLIIRLSDSKVKVEYGKRSPTQSVEPEMWVADIGKAKRLLGWAPRHSFEDGLRKDIQWFRENADKY